MYQALSLQGKRINSLTIEMEQVKLDQKEATKEMNLYTRTEHSNQLRKDTNGREMPYIYSPQ